MGTGKKRKRREKEERKRTARTIDVATFKDGTEKNKTTCFTKY